MPFITGCCRLLPVGVREFQVVPRAFGLFPGRPVSLDPFCLLKVGTLGCISDAAKKPGYGTANCSSTLLGNTDHGMPPPLIACLHPRQRSQPGYVTNWPIWPWALLTDSTIPDA